MPDDNENDVEKSPVDELLDVIVFAPLGLALVARDQLPALIERGRKQWAEQSTLARMMGQYAIKEARKDATKRFRDIAETLSTLSGPPTAPATAPKPKPTATSATPAKPAAAPAPAAAPVDTEPAPSSAHLAIPGYDTLSASQVVQRLAGLTADELDAVRAYEEATRGRRTILSKVAQLQ